MHFNLEKSLEILERTPQVLTVFLENLAHEWTNNTEGTNTWSAFDIVGHLIHGEKTDWIPRTKLILGSKTPPTFASFDRFAQFDSSKDKNLTALLKEFMILRTKNIEILKTLEITPFTLQKTAFHPQLGEITLAELLATWVTHDLNHIAQISRVMAKQYKDNVGPWVAYIGVLKI